ncbi:hypothetical protein Pint_03750 [Pistacia integerrima]|uniref:Uncharacterized protein n=1 Tax=Pistacia integerrima TaxID=434235 RepID=A0ACC0Z6L2_9ROSI|nr:hypothetical protein Pint_03750 [Pistacia integerrima]
MQQPIEHGQLHQRCGQKQYIKEGHGGFDIDGLEVEVEVEVEVEGVAVLWPQPFPLLI